MKMLRQEYLTIKDFKNMGLSEFQIDELIRYENNKHNFGNRMRSANDIEAPHSLFFIDIKDTLYHSCGHGGKGVLGRSYDSMPIYLNDLFSLGNLLEKTTGQLLTVHNVYSLNEKNMPRLVYDFPSVGKRVQYKLDIPAKINKEPLTGNLRYESLDGPFRVIFVSSDDIETQKNIITFLLIIYKINMTPIIYWHGEIGMREIIKLEELFGKCNCDLDKFIDNLPEDYKKTLNFGTVREDIKNILNRLTFLSTKDTKLTKRDLMQKYLGHYNHIHGLTYDDYNIFATGDNLVEDGPMIKLAYELGGLGYLNNLRFFPMCQAEDLRVELYEESRLEIRTPLVVNGFNEFYSNVISALSLERTIALAETMQDVNLGREEEFNRFRKTNHYLKVKRLQK